MNIPETLKVAGFNYCVERPYDSFIINGDPCDGVHDFGQQLIRVARTNSSEYQQVVFLHEMAHAIVANYCSGILDDDTEERFVEQFAKGLYQVLNDNEHIFIEEE